MAKKKEVEVIDMGGAKTVAKKTSFITRVKVTFGVFSVIWIALVIWFPLHVKNTYSDSIKQSTVVAIFYDLQRNIADSYEKMLNGIKKSINLEKPIAQVIDKVKMAEDSVTKVTDTTAKASNTTAKAKNTTSGVKALSGIAGKFGVNTSGVDKAVASADKAIGKADSAIAQVDDTAALVNKKLNGIEKDLTKAAKAEVDKVIDDAIKSQVDSSVSMLLTKYNIKHVYPWEPSSWPTARKIYAELVKSDVDFVQTIIKTVNKYFGYFAWGLVIAAWAAGLYIWLTVRKKVKHMISPFIVCPRCGHTFADKRTVISMLKVFQPWKWI
ncbi:MAG: hypothetical protein J5679_01625 [Alphaproteobacteria bacterium]|nr:hypothetical protein [Alphaproteobacteria bacterium]